MEYTEQLICWKLGRMLLKTFAIMEFMKEIVSNMYSEFL